MSGTAERGTVPDCLQHRTRTELARILHSAREALRADAAGIILLRPDAACVNVAATIERVQSADQLQDELTEGPYTLIGQSPTLFSSDIAADPRWPHWGPAARTLGLRSLVCAQLRLAAQPVGALTLYSNTPRSFTTDAGVIHLYARQAVT